MKKLLAIEKMLLLSIAFTILLLVIRIYYSQKITFVFFIWNIFLAIVPLVFSRQLKYEQNMSFKTFVFLTIWLVFFPNAPYIITDLFHFIERPPVPKWYDLILIISAVWNGLLLGIVSLMQVETFLKNHFQKKWVNFLIAISMLLCGYGVFIGRFIRLNSWDIVTNPTNVIFTSFQYFFKPWKHVHAWAFIFLFAVLFSLVYYTLKQFVSIIKINDEIT
ncbi:MAG: DUF1361 domain-containing protein [Chitinophagaceae bacterium]|jgi:uncharacterized membrane protein|nr:DUF1361 domain-containing protein [Chitinophagaceae bacterium]